VVPDRGVATGPPAIGSRFIALAVEDVPRIPLFQAPRDVATRKNVTGYRYWFPHQLDYRRLLRT
jgi:peptide/nickel transport system substrate-binding protein